MIEHFYHSLPGFFTFEDYYSGMANMFRLLGRPARIAEVGVFAGKSAAFLCTELENKGVDYELHGVDHFTQVPVDAVRANLYRFRDRVKLHQAKSWAAAAQFPDEHFDMVFIDAGHTYEDVSRDIDAWLPKVKGGYIIAGHDFSDEFPGVVRAVVERFETFDVERGTKYTNGLYYPVWTAVKR